MTIDPVYLFAVALALVALSFAWGVRVADSAWMANAERVPSGCVRGYRCRGLDFVVIPSGEFWRKWHRIPDAKLPAFTIAQEERAPSGDGR